MGAIHNHPGNSAPSPSDVLTGVNISQMLDLHSGDVDFVAKNNVSIVVTNNYIYTRTIKYLAKFESYQNDFNANRSARNTEYLQHSDNYLNSINSNSTPLDRGEYALQKMYGDAVNIVRSNRSGNPNGKVFELNNWDEYVQYKDPCK